MDVFTKILEGFGIRDYDNLNSLEQQTIREWVDKVEKSAITLDDIRNGVKVMREGLEQELVNLQNDSRKDLFLKARLKNLILIETILTRPEKARAALDSYIARGKAQVTK